MRLWACVRLPVGPSVALHLRAVWGLPVYVPFWV